MDTCLRMTAGFAKSPFGTCLIAETPRGICHLSFVAPKKAAAAWRKLQQAWPRAVLCRDDARALFLIKRIFTRPKRPKSGAAFLRIFAKGTHFQRRVWKALCKVPQGRLTTYGHLAAAVGNLSAARAVGSAVGANPVAYLIPCHRVIRKTGSLGEYHWGRARKQALLAWEGAPLQLMRQRQEDLILRRAL